MHQSAPLNVLVWGENRHEQFDEKVRAIYPDGMHATIAEGLAENLGERAVVTTVTLDDPDQGITEELLERTDVLLWWGHMAHGDVTEETVDRVQRAVLAGMGIIVLHSGHFSKIFQRLMGTSCVLRWRNGDDRELVWTIAPSHPIAQGVSNPIVIEAQEMYGEFFDVPTPDEVVFISSFSGGEVFRSGITYQRGFGRVFYFSPGDQDYPVYHHPDIRRVLSNGVVWAAGERRRREAPQIARYDVGEFSAPLVWPVAADEPAS
ncbi:ThuA domain-containing protein [Microbacterium sp. NPDC019599]|uniref:ThuA domain-containing protein n=1 Tax=Microbacterium sp. NPDC019599 TaxID=3154690 RepID=UPI0033C853AD